MRKFIIYTVLLFVSVVAKAAELTSLEHWESGNKAYVAGDYNKAIEEYNAILDGGEYSLELYYNIANAYFKADNLGKAILYYNKALRIDPSQEDILHNLSFAEARTKDKVADAPEFFLNSWMRSMRNTMDCTAWSILSLVSIGLLLACVVIFLLASRIGVRKCGFYGALCAIILVIATTSFAISSRNEILEHEEAVIMASAISIKSSPDSSSTDLFVLHEGSKVRVVSMMDDWCEVALADGRKGWVEKKNVEEI